MDLVLPAATCVSVGRVARKRSMDGCPSHAQCELQGHNAALPCSAAVLLALSQSDSCEEGRGRRAAAECGGGTQ